MTNQPSPSANSTKTWQGPALGAVLCVIGVVAMAFLVQKLPDTSLWYFLQGLAVFLLVGGAVYFAIQAFGRTGSRR